MADPREQRGEAIIQTASCLSYIGGAITSRLGSNSVSGLVIAISIGLLISVSQLFGADVPDSTTAAVRARLSSLTSSDESQLAKVLGVAPSAKEAPPDAANGYFQDLGDLDGDGVNEFELVWTAGQNSASEGNESAALSWSLFLLAWDGSHWQASPLLSGFERFLLQVLPRTSPGERGIAVIVLAGATDIPFPAVFQFRAHKAALAWDGRSDESRYEGYDNGRLDFRVEHGALQMISTGRADPGLLIFPKNGNRGFDARTIYDWDHNAFVPVATEYAACADYTLYRFISALHLKDFRTAYTLIDPAKFMATDKPTPAAFRKLIEDKWQEFLDDKIFRAEDSSPGDVSFTLSMPDRIFVYTPEFSGKTQILLSGLTRHERKPEDP